MSIGYPSPYDGPRFGSLGSSARHAGVRAWLQSPAVNSPDRGPGDTEHPARRYYRACALGGVAAGFLFAWMLAIGRLDFLQMAAE